MDYEEYINFLQNKFNRYFDIKRNINILGIQIDMFAKYFERNGRTLITQKDVIDVYENHELCFIKYYENISIDNIKEYEKFLVDAVARYVKPHNEHMCTYVTGVMVSKEKVNEECSCEIKKFKYSKAFKFYLHGWCEVRLIVVDLSRGNVITNSKGKNVKKVYEYTP